MNRARRILAYVRYRKCYACGVRNASVAPSADGTMACPDCAMKVLRWFGYNRAYRRRRGQ